MTAGTPLRIAPPVRVLCAISNPSDAVRFDSTRVRNDLAEALSRFTSDGSVVLEFLADPTENGLRHALARNPQVLHLVAHAQERRGVHWGAITLQSADGKARNLTGPYLADLLYGIPSLKLVVLQACDETCGFDIMAETLAEQGLVTVALPPLNGNPVQMAVAALYGSAIANPPGADGRRSEEAVAPSPVDVGTVGKGSPAVPSAPQTAAVLPVPKAGAPVEVFFSYSHEDEELRIALEKHLALLQRQGLIVEWHDRRIGAGDSWIDSIDVHVRTAQMILLLISSDFLASDYCYGIEMKIALERTATNEAVVIPVILRPVDWSDASFSHLEALPRDAKPITMWPNRDEAFADVARGIRARLTDISSNPRRAS